MKSTKVVGKKVIKDAAIEGAIYSTANSVHQKATKGNVDAKEVLNAGIEGAGRRAAGEVAGLGIGKGLERGANKIINSRAGKKAIKQVNDFVGEISQSKFATGLKNQYDNALYHAKNFIADESGHIKLPGGGDLKVRNVSFDDTVRSDNFININLQLHSSKGKADELVNLYHGTKVDAANSIRKNGVDLNHATRNMDFGRGFYTTTDIQQAKKWIDMRHRGNGSIVEFNIPKSEFDALNGKLFSYGNSDWIEFVTNSRTGMANSYDYVSGPMLMNSKEYLKYGHKPIAKGQQTAFNTKAGVDLLNKFMKR